MSTINLWHVGAAIIIVGVAIGAALALGILFSKENDW